MKKLIVKNQSIARLFLLFTMLICMSNVAQSAQKFWRTEGLGEYSLGNYLRFKLDNLDVAVVLGSWKTKQFPVFHFEGSDAERTFTKDDLRVLNLQSIPSVGDRVRIPTKDYMLRLKNVLSRYGKFSDSANAQWEAFAEQSLQRPSQSAQQFWQTEGFEEHPRVTYLTFKLDKPDIAIALGSWKTEQFPFPLFHFEGRDAKGTFTKDDLRVLNLQSVPSVGDKVQIPTKDYMLRLKNVLSRYGKFSDSANAQWEQFFTMNLGQKRAERPSESPKTKPPQKEPQPQLSLSRPTEMTQNVYKTISEFGGGPDNHVDAKQRLILKIIQATKEQEKSVRDLMVKQAASQELNSDDLVLDLIQKIDVYKNAKFLGQLLGVKGGSSNIIDNETKNPTYFFVKVIRTADESIPVGSVLYLHPDRYSGYKVDYNDRVYFNRASKLLPISIGNRCNMKTVLQVVDFR